MKTHNYPTIQTSEIRKGDLIRYERGSLYVGSDRAHEYFAERDGDTAGYGHNHYYLIDRPAPPVDLPETPTLGWARWADANALAVWERKGDALTAVDSTGYRRGATGRVEAFVPAVAVPAEALNELREGVEAAACIESHLDRATFRHSILIDFIDAVTEANS